MPKTSKPRAGSLQFWPRKRAKKLLPSVNWKIKYSSSDSGKILGFICYKVGMLGAICKDNTKDSMTQNKEIYVPTTILECPPMKILSIRFYKNNQVSKEIIISNDRELRRKIKVPKNIKKENIDKEIAEIESDIEKFEDIRIICYSLVNRTGIKKTPDLIEIGLSGSITEKLNKIKSLIGKDISITEVFSSNQLVDIHGVTKGKGLQGPVKRFGIGLKQHKSEKGVRRPGSLGPWTPKRVSFRVPMAGQLGYGTRAEYNKKILDLNSISSKNINPKSGFTKYGNINTSYIILKGSVQGARKRQLLMTSASRPTKKTQKENYEILNLE